MPRKTLTNLLCAVLLLLNGCSAGRIEMRDVAPPAFTPERRAALEADLAAAERELAANPDSEDAAIWVARRLGYLGRYADAIDVLTRAAANHPQSYRILRHRGHRWITVRRFDLAIKDLSRAWRLAQNQPDQIEPDGAPTPGVPPRSTDHSNILYHWGLAHYLRAEYAQAETLFAQAADLPLTNDDNRVSCGHWRWLSLMRLGRVEDAAALQRTFRRDMDVRENRAYHRLMLLYATRSVEDISNDPIGADPAYQYGAAAHQLLINGPHAARSRLLHIIEAANPASFAHIAAEADIARLWE
ncbi:MAG: tetratricopeptide repeat protein [Phycisphaerales bacterium]